jgi:TRAP-type C4-dicarboxylate transport system permease small subunit
MVFIRYVLNDNTIWQTDFVTYSLIAATFLGAPYVLLTKGHVNVDVLPIYGRARALCRRFGHGLAGFCC